MKSNFNLKKSNHLLTILSVLTFILCASSMAYGQANRTWVSGTGNDADLCSREMPCKTFAGAISKTSPGGEINALDPGGFGGVTINQAIVIDGAATNGGILVTGTNAIAVSAASTDRVILRHLSINGLGTGLQAIRGLSFKSLDIENCYIENFTQAGVSIEMAISGSRVTVKDTNINNTVVGIQMTTTTGYVTGTFDNVRVDNCASGIIAKDRGYINLRNSIIEACSVVGASIQAPSNSAGLNLENTMLYSVETGVQAGGPGTKVDLSNTSILNNSVAISSSGGSVFSHGNNRIAYNSSPGVAPTLVGQQ